MSVLTIIAKLSDGVPLVETYDENDESRSLVESTYRSQAKTILKSLSIRSPNKMKVESGKYSFYYLINNGVCYLTLFEKSFQQKNCFDFLDEIQKEFDLQYSQDIANIKRPYACQKFGNSCKIKEFFFFFFLKEKLPR
jgi:vesicle transport protein SEC22